MKQSCANARCAAGVAQWRMFAVAVLALLMPRTVDADAVYLIPPNDTTGHVYSTNANDGYSDGRGDVFRVTADTVINSVGLYQNLTNVVLSYRVWETPVFTGNVNSGATLLRSGSATASTSGLEYIDFSFAELTLLGGRNYHVEFQHNGVSSQNFFYNNNNVTFSQGNFQFIDGTHGGLTGNSVMPAIRLNVVEAAPVPLPAAAWGGMALMGLVGAKRLRGRRGPRA